MLTKTDLNLIRQVVREEIQGEVPSMIKKELEPLRLEMRSGFKHVNKRIDIVISGFDSEYLDLERRVTTIEERLRITSAR